jgi:V/A-type H+-transporting ATPase subunit D
MSKLALNKTSMNQQKRQLATYQRFLPALEMKREQLMQEKKKAERQVWEKEQHIEELSHFIGDRLPMLGAENVVIEDLVTLGKVHVREENLLGLKLPVLDGVDVDVVPYSYLARPHWVDNFVLSFQQLLQEKVGLSVLQRRLTLLQRALRTTTQRVNLFSSVLIPGAQKNIKRIRLFLDDQERAGVVRSKLAKQKLLASEELLA